MKEVCIRLDDENESTEDGFEDAKDCEGELSTSTYNPGEPHSPSTVEAARQRGSTREHAQLERAKACLLLGSPRER